MTEQEAVILAGLLAGGYSRLHGGSTDAERVADLKVWAKELAK